MTHGVIPISRGKSPKGFKVYLPFNLSEIGRLSESNTSDEAKFSSVNLDGVNATIKRKDHFYVLETSEFKTKLEAELFLTRISVALMFASIKQKVAIHFSSIPIPIEKEANKETRDRHNPEAYKPWRKRKDKTFTDGGIWSNQTAIIPNHKRIVEHQMFWGSRINILTISSISNSFSIVKNFNNKKLLKNKKLTLAFRLYSYAYSNKDSQITFLNLVTILELLSESNKTISKFSLNALNKAKNVIKQERDKHKNDKFNELNKLLSRIAKLKEITITEKICQYVYQLLYSTKAVVSGLSIISQKESDEKLKQLYNVRSKLVHTGEVKPTNMQNAVNLFNESYAFIDEIVPFLLLAEMCNSMQIQTLTDISILSQEY